MEGVDRELDGHKDRKTFDLMDYIENSGGTLRPHLDLHVHALIRGIKDKLLQLTGMIQTQGNAEM